MSKKTGSVQWAIRHYVKDVKTDKFRLFMEIFYPTREKMRDSWRDGDYSNRINPYFKAERVRCLHYDLIDYRTYKPVR